MRRDKNEKEEIGHIEATDLLDNFETEEETDKIQREIEEIDEKLEKKRKAEVKKEP